MSKAYKCNRCGRFYEPYDGVVFKDGLGEKYCGCELMGGAHTYPHFDLCLPCMRSLIGFLKNNTYIKPTTIEEDCTNE